MRKKSDPFKAITDNFNKIVTPHQLYALDAHIAIYDLDGTIRGYFNQNCYAELIQLISERNDHPAHPIGLS